MTTEARLSATGDSEAGGLSEKPPTISDRADRLVLCVPAEELDGLGFGPGWTPAADEDVTDLLQNATWRPKAAAETDERFRQVIPYVMIQESPDRLHRVLVYRRSKQSGEVRLQGQWSVGFGGHVEEDDAVQVQRLAAVRMAADREVQEEIGLSPCDLGAALTIHGIIRYDGDPVGRVHVGVGMRLVLPARPLPFRYGAEVAEPAFRDAYKVYTAGGLENWSAITLRAFLYGPPR